MTFNNFFPFPTGNPLEKLLSFCKNVERSGIWCRVRMWSWKPVRDDCVSLRCWEAGEMLVIFNRETSASRCGGLWHVHCAIFYFLNYFCTGIAGEAVTLIPPENLLGMLALENGVQPQPLVRFPQRECTVNFLVTKKVILSCACQFNTLHSWSWIIQTDFVVLYHSTIQQNSEKRFFGCLYQKRGTEEFLFQPFQFCTRKITRGPEKTVF